MASFNFQRGCVITVDQGEGGAGSSIINVPGLSKRGDSPVLITGVQVMDKDLVLPVVTLDNFRILYTFGQDFGEFNIIGTALLGAVGGTGDALAHVTKWFSENRITKKPSSISVSLGGGGTYEVFVTGLNISQADLTLHIQPFIIVCNIAKAP